MAVMTCRMIWKKPWWTESRWKREPWRLHSRMSPRGGADLLAGMFELGGDVVLVADGRAAEDEAVFVGRDAELCGLLVDGSELGVQNAEGRTHAIPLV
jgi:hypothetical protein